MMARIIFSARFCAAAVNVDDALVNKMYKKSKDFSYNISFDGEDEQWFNFSNSYNILIEPEKFVVMNLEDAFDRAFTYFNKDVVPTLRFYSIEDARKVSAAFSDVKSYNEETIKEQRGYGITAVEVVRGKLLSERQFHSEYASFSYKIITDNISKMELEKKIEYMRETIAMHNRSMEISHQTIERLNEEIKNMEKELAGLGE